MSQRKKIFLCLLFTGIIVLVAFFLSQKDLVLATFSLFIDPKNDGSEIHLAHGPMPLTYPIDTEEPTRPTDENTTPIPSSTSSVTTTRRATSTPWPSRTPTPTPPYIYRATNTPEGYVVSTVDVTNNNPNTTLTAFFATQTARYSKKTETHLPSSTPTMTPQPTEEPTHDENQKEPGDTQPTQTHTLTAKAVTTRKSTRYEERKESYWPFILIFVVFASIGVVVYQWKRQSLR